MSKKLEVMDWFFGDNVKDLSQEDKEKAASYLEDGEIYKAHGLAFGKVEEVPKFLKTTYTGRLTSSESNLPRLYIDPCSKRWKVLDSHIGNCKAIDTSYRYKELMDTKRQQLIKALEVDFYG